jgi:hypothetical protein
VTPLHQGEGKRREGRERRGREKEEKISKIL